VGSHTDKLVLLALADNANDQGECYPSLTMIAEKCEMSRRTVAYSISRLSTAGHVSKKTAPGRNTVYLVHPTSANGAPVQTVHQCTDCTSASGAPTSASGAPPPPISPSLINPPPLDPPLKTVINRQTRVRAREAIGEGKRTTEPEGPPPSTLNVEVWHRWEQYRREIRKPIKPASKLAAQRKLAAFGTDQDAVVEQSIANGWQGLFPLGGRAQPEKPVLTWRPPPDEEDVSAR
jgi:DNA-binding MarR family transcriptional regulator